MSSGSATKRTRVRAATKAPPVAPKRKRKLTAPERQAIATRLLELRERVLAQGDTLDSWEDVMREVADRRGGLSRQSS